MILNQRSANAYKFIVEGGVTHGGKRSTSRDRLHPDDPPPGAGRFERCSAKDLLRDFGDGTLLHS